MLNKKKEAARSEKEATELAAKPRTAQDVQDDVQVMKAVRVFNSMLKADRMTYITYCSIKEHIPDMCQAITDNAIFKEHYADIKIDRFLKVWPQIMHLKDKDLGDLIKTLEAVKCEQGTKTQ